ncbi:MAG: PAS domain S-box protein [Acidobacteriota bacterium]
MTSGPTTVLIVGTSEVNGALGDTVLWRDDIRRICVPGASAALDEARAQRPAMVVIGSGDFLQILSLVRGLREEATTRSTGIVVLSCGLTHEGERELRSAGVNAILTTPVDPLQWDSRLAELMNVPPRRAARMPVRIRSWVRDEEGAEETWGDGLNISVHGMLIETAHPLVPKRKLDIRFRLPGREEELEVVGQVVRLGAVVEGRQQSGVEFVILRGRAEEGIHEFVLEAERSSWSRTHVGSSAEGQWERELRDTEAWKVAILESALDCIVATDAEGRIVEFNRSAETTFGWSRSEVLGRNLAEVIMPPQVRAQQLGSFLSRMATAGEELTRRRLELTAVRTDGREVRLEVSIAPVDVKGRRLHAAFMRDVTVRDRLERFLAGHYAVAAILAMAPHIRKAARPLLRSLCASFACDVGVFWLTDETGSRMNCLDIWHSSRAEPVHFEAACRETELEAPTEPPVVRPAMPDLQAGKSPRALAAAFEGLHSVAAIPIAVGATRHGFVELFGRGVRPLDPELLERTAPLGTQIGQFIEQKRAEEALRRRDGILRAVAQTAHMIIGATDWELRLPESLRLIAQASCASRVCLYAVEDSGAGGFEAVLRGEWLDGQASEDVTRRPLQRFRMRDAGLQVWEETLGRGDVIEGAARGGRACEEEGAGAVAEGAMVVVPIFASGAWWGYLRFDGQQQRWSSPEIDAIRTAADILSSAVERGMSTEALARSEEMLRQSQKMEAVGRLAGGIAHDFNNLLNVIGGYAELLLQTLSADAASAPRVKRILDACARASSLTSQLLAFSRKSPIRPVTADVNRLASDGIGILRQLIGEDISLATSWAPGPLWVCIDRGMLNQVLINLAINARDAMPRGGRLTIETRVASRGETAAWESNGRHYAEMKVTDTGCGMDEETQRRAFEPFFTTKPEGRGTGLGLATVYGIVKQAGGYVSVESSPGRGAAFSVLLPIVEPPGAGSTLSRDELIEAGGTETILLVEDDRDVRAVTRAILESAGYLVLEAADGAEALRVSGSHPGPVHILVADVVMPGMSGLDVASLLLSTRTDMKVLHVSGHAQDVMEQYGALDGTRRFLRKPYTSTELLRGIRKALRGGDDSDR